MFRKAVLTGIAVMLLAPACFAESLKDRIAVHLSAGMNEPQDKQGGGFRFGSTRTGTLAGGEREVEIDNGMRWEIGVQYAFREGKKAVMALELEAAYFKEGIGSESTLRDPNASLIQETYLPGSNGIPFPVGESQDEVQRFMELGEITMIPVSANVLWHFGHRRGRTSAYVGGGPSWIFTDFDLEDDFRDFVGYQDGDVDDGPGLNLKGGIQVFLTEDWIFDFHINYLLTDEQFRWNGVNRAFGEQAFDTDGDNIPDLFGRPADLRIADPGNLRLDGLAFSAGIRYAFPRFKKKAAKTSPEGGS